MVLSLLLSACVAQPHRSPPVQKPTRVPQDSPAHDAQSRLLQEAHRAFLQERYRAAVLFFNRFAEVAPNSPRLAEARWWLGRAYEQIGDYRSAMEQYRAIAANMETAQQDGTSFEGDALRRLDELRQVSADQRNGRLSQLALRLGMDRLPPRATLASWLEELVEAKVMALVIDFGSGPTVGLTATDLEAIKGSVTQAHRQGLQLWIRLDLHRGIGRNSRPEWIVRRCYGRADNGDGDAPLDVANPAYQAAVEETVRVLSSLDIDGLVLAARSTDRFADECSEESVQEFSRWVGGNLTPEWPSGTAVVPGDSTQERPVQYWRWVGWKARSYAQWAMRLRKVLRTARPTAILLTEIHSSTLAAPLQGLERFGEDVAEMVAHTGGWIVVRSDESIDAQALERLHRQIGAKGRVWVERLPKTTQDRAGLTALRELITGFGLDQWSVLIRVDSGEAIP